MRSSRKWIATGLGVGLASYAAYVGISWLRFGRPERHAPRDVLLDAFMPAYDAAERHKIRVAAPADVTLATAMDLELESSAIARAIFKGRELLLRSKPSAVAPHRPGLVEEMKSIGWGVLAESPGCEIVMGAVTKPWEANPVFRTLSPAEFTTFAELGYVKIAWAVRAAPTADGSSIFRTETRAVATDREARSKFRWYWSFLSPGIILIRRAMLPTIRANAQRRTHGPVIHSA